MEEMSKSLLIGDNYESKADGTLVYKEPLKSKDTGEVVGIEEVPLANHTPILQKQRIVDNGIEPVETLVFNVRRAGRMWGDVSVTLKEILSQTPNIKFGAACRLFVGRGIKARYSEAMQIQCENAPLETLYGIKSKSSDFSNAAKTLVDGFKNSITTNAATCKSSVTSWASNLKDWFTSSSYGAINRTTWGNYAKDIVSGFSNGITNNYTTAKSGMTTFANYVKNTFKDIVSYDKFYDIAKDVIKGFNNGINDYYDTTLPYMRKWANAAAQAYKAALDSNSPSKRFMRIGEDTVLGYNIGIQNLASTTTGVVTDWANSFSSVSPTMSFAVDTSALKYYNSDSFAGAVSAGISSSNRYAVESSCTIDGLKDAVLSALVESGLVEDVRRQADKEERTIVQIGNRTVSDTVDAQKRANGYRFVTV